MQIDCEVVNTSLLRIREKTVPDNLKADNKYRAKDNLQKTATNSSVPTTNVNVNLDNASNRTNKFKTTNPLDKYKPYFMKEELVNLHKLQVTP